MYIAYLLCKYIGSDSGPAGSECSAIGWSAIKKLAPTAAKDGLMYMGGTLWKGFKMGGFHSVEESRSHILFVLRDTTHIICKGGYSRFLLSVSY